MYKENILANEYLVLLKGWNSQDNTCNSVKMSVHRSFRVKASGVQQQTLHLLWTVKGRGMNGGGGEIERLQKRREEKDRVRSQINYTKTVKWTTGHNPPSAVCSPVCLYVCLSPASFWMSLKSKNRLQDVNLKDNGIPVDINCWRKTPAQCKKFDWCGRMLCLRWTELNQIKCRKTPP